MSSKGEEIGIVSRGLCLRSCSLKGESFFNNSAKNPGEVGAFSLKSTKIVVKIGSVKRTTPIERKAYGVGVLHTLDGYCSKLPEVRVTGFFTGSRSLFAVVGCLPRSTSSNLDMTVNSCARQESLCSIEASRVCEVAVTLEMVSCRFSNLLSTDTVDNGS